MIDIFKQVIVVTETSKFKREKLRSHCPNEKIDCVDQSHPNIPEEELKNLQSIEGVDLLIII